MRWLLRRRTKPGPSTPNNSTRQRPASPWNGTVTWPDKPSCSERLWGPTSFWTIWRTNSFTLDGFLEVQPDDRQVLLRVSQVMAEPQRIPEDGPARTEHLEAAEDYAARAVDAVDAYVTSPDSAEIEDLEKAAMVSQANTALGMVHFQQQEFRDAALAYGRAADSVPEAQLYFLLGVAHFNDQNVDPAVSALARAVFLDFPQPQARQLLEVAYEVQNGSLDGLDDYIESEGGQLTADR